MFRLTSKKARQITTSKRRVASCFRPRFETLEDRLALATAYGLTDGNSLVRFDTDSPTSITSTIPITGITAGETLVGIDFRPQNGLLYGLGVNAAANTATLYAISNRTGVAGVVGSAPSGIAYTTDGATPVDLPDPATVGYGFDFNPAADRVRIVAGSLNLRVNPNTGGPVDGDAATMGTNPDGAISGGTTTLDGTAYANSQPNTTITTQYTLDAASNSLFIQNPPNNGTQTLGQVVTLGGPTLDFTAVNGFDIPAGVNAPASNAPVTTGSAFAALNVGGTTSLYSVNLVNGQATLIGNIGTGTTGLKGFAVQSDLGGFPAIGLQGANLVRFNTATPGTSTTVPITGVTASETLVGIDFRPQTGQLFGLGVNATANNASLYLIDPQTGAATVVGTASQVTYVDAAGNPVDLPDPATAGYGFDFNPTVDRVRVTTSTGLNFRANPNNGAPVDGNLNLTPAPNGTNPDGNINGLPAGSTGVSATAYTNSFGQSLTGGVTTQYTIDAASNTLFIQNPPNAGGQTTPLPITLGGAPLDFTDVNGFDIPASVRVPTSNTPATGSALAALTVGGTTSIFQINLATGAATSLGTVATTLNGFTLGDRPFVAAATTTVLTSSANPAVVGDEVTFTAMVSAAAGASTPTGTVTFRIDGGSAAVVPLDASGEASFSTSTLDVGTFTITADFTSNNSDTLNSSDTLIQSVVPVRPPAGSAGLSPDPFIPGNTALVIAGTTRSDTIIVKPVSGQARVILNGRTIGNFPLSDFDSIAVFADAGNDTVVIAKAILKPTTIDGEAGNDTLIGGNGSDTLVGGLGRDTLVGLGGDDLLTGNDGNDVLDGGAGNDVLSGDAGNDTLVGGSGNDSLSGGDGNDVLSGGSGSDGLTGDDGNDKVFGGSGDDVARGGLGNDKVFGDAGNDFVLGAEGNDQLYGGSGRDIVVGGDGADTLFGEGGDDIVVADSTSIDDDEAAAAEVFAELTSSNAYAVRVENIRALGITILDDGAIDTLFGNGGLDWFIFSPGDRVRDRARNELVN